MRDLLRDRDFRLLFAGQSLSMFGDMAMLLVLAMWAKELTGSSGVAGSVIGAVVLPSLLAPLGGVLIDRFRRRTVMVVTDLATAAVVLLLLLVDGREDLWLLYLVAFLYGASLVAFSSARSALLGTMIPDDRLGQANGSLSTVREALRLVAPLAGAALYAGFGGPAVAVVMRPPSWSRPPPWSPFGWTSPRRCDPHCASSARPVPAAATCSAAGSCAPRSSPR
jgi:MFS family permease